MEKNFILENGIYCKGKPSKFKLYYNNIALTPHCNAMAYVRNTLIAVKCDKTIFVYKPELKKYNNSIVLAKIATFQAYDNYFIYLNVKVKDKVYIIDSNIQISLCEYTKMH